MKKVLASIIALWLVFAAYAQDAPTPPPDAPTATNLDVEIVSYGIGAPLEGKYLIRQGQWVPVLTKLTLHTGSPMEVELHCESRDLDGDYVSFVESGVTLTPGSENQKRVWLYAIAPWSASMQNPTISVHEVNGGTVGRGQVQTYATVSNDTMCVLDVSDRPVTRLRDVISDPATAESGDLGSQRPYMRHAIVARMPSTDVPDKWFGLESIDALVWDEPDLSDSSKFSNAQIEAVKGWVAHGGTLIVGLGGTWPTVRKSPLADILPVKGDGPPMTAKRLSNFFARYAGGSVQEFKSPVDLAVVENRNGIPVLFDRADGITDVSLIVEGKYGSGRVVCVAAPLRALTDVIPKTNDQFLRYLLDIQRISLDLVQSEAQQSYSLLSGRTRLFGLLTEGKIDFRSEQTVLDLAAMTFVLAYGVAATIGSWWWLRRNNLTQLSWTVFCVFAISASALSLTFVLVAHGRSRVDSIQIVDFDSGAGDARAHCWFGMRAGNIPANDVSLPGSGSYLRPLARGNDDAGEYSTPQRYSDLVDKAALVRVPLRAAAKQFEGEWEGQINGSIRTLLAADRGSGQIDPSSWIKNDLSVDLEGGYLLYLDPRCDAVRAMGSNTDYRGRTNVPSSMNVLAVQIAPLKAGAQIAGLNADRYREIRDDRLQWNQNQSANKGPMPDLDTLFMAQWSEIGGISGVTAVLKFATDKSWNAAFLLSTRDLYTHAHANDLKSLGFPITSRGLSDCDISHWITQGYGALILWSREPGPVQLHADGHAVRTRSIFTVYRVRVPVALSGTRPTGGDQ